MTTLILSFLAYAAIIFLAGVVLSYAADQIAEITGFGRLLIGSILLAGATSLPELTVDITAVRLGHVDLAAGDLIGSCLMNLLILAVLDLTTYSRGKMLSREAAAHALSATLSTVMLAVVALAILASGKLPNFELVGLAPATWVIIALYVLGVRVVFIDQRIAAAAAPQPQTSPHRIPVWRPFTMFALATVALVIVGPRLAETAGNLADASGLGKTFVGTTLVALTTSLPELVSSFVAIRMGAADLAVGNVFGSNAFNMLLFVVLDFLQPGSVYAAVSPTHVVTSLAVIIATSTAVMGQLYRVERRSPLIEPDAWLIILISMAALGIVYQSG